MFSALVSIVLMLVLAAIVIIIVSKLGMGLAVDGFASAFIAAAVIAIVAGVVTWLLSFLNLNFGPFLGMIVYLIVAAVILMISDRFVKGMKVDGFAGAIIAAIGIGVVYWLVSLLLNTILNI
ncbi:MAG: phage holin family protein [Anaerolineae bacterium]|nr:phage holin family protein [Anaerolineae bacterium]